MRRGIFVLVLGLLLLQPRASRKYRPNTGPDYVARDRAAVARHGAH